MTGLDKLIIPHNQQSCGLIAFCRRSVQNALDDACGILSKFEQKGNTKLFHISTWVQNKGKQLLYVLQEEDIQGCIQRIEMSMAGLGIAIQTAALAQTHDAYNENKVALGQLTEKLSENLERLERNHNEILKNQGNGEASASYNLNSLRPQQPKTWAGLSEISSFHKSVFCQFWRKNLMFSHTPPMKWRTWLGICR
ncbi:hypothetical protein CcaCcLH18_12363 [Colletotrichum camelliae]|nr:hypothetical protein CcaCcLH18_12363 [Colletotrichum camelliae]